MDSSKQVDVLGSTFPLPVEVIPMARSQVGRKLVSLGGAPEYREGVVTDNGNVILDVHNFAILNPVEMEKELNNVAGVVTNGIFALRGADIVIVGTPDGAKIIDYKNKEANMTNKVSLDKSKIKFVLLEGVHQSALDTLHAAGYTNIAFTKKL